MNKIIAKILKKVSEYLKEVFDEEQRAMDLFYKQFAQE